MNIEPKSNTFFAALSEADRKKLLLSGTRRQLGDREVLFNEGSKSSEIFVVLSGNVMLTKDTIDGDYIVVELRGAGALLGELSALDMSSRSAGATTVQRTEVLKIDAALFLSLAETNQGIRSGLQMAMAEKVRQSSARQLETSTTDSLGRVCARLVELCTLSGVRTGKNWDVPSLLSQKELAAWVGVSRDAVVGSLRKARRLGWVETGRLRFVITDLGAIESRAMAA